MVSQLPHSYRSSGIRIDSPSGSRGVTIGIWIKSAVWLGKVTDVGELGMDWFPRARAQDAIGAFRDIGRRGGRHC